MKTELAFADWSRLMATDARSRSTVNAPVRESLDGNGAGDHDVAYMFGRVPRALAPFPFSTRQFARLLVLRGRIRAARFAENECR
jgi:hypothetical protein